MDLHPYVVAVADDLGRATALADDATREIAAKVATAIEPAVRLALVQALSDAAAAITADLDDAVVSVRMEGREPVLDVRATPHPTPTTPHTPQDAGGPQDAEAPEEAEEAGTARVTVRLPEPLKRRAESQASDAGQSLNTWIVHALRRATDTRRSDPEGGRPPAAHSARQFTGWA